VILTALVGLAALFSGGTLARTQAPSQIGPTSLEKVDDYPLYVMTYAGDYGFDEYLQHGVTDARPPAISPADSAEWACTTFAALNPGGEALLGRNFDWHNRATLILYTDPSDGYASVSLVDIAYLGYDADTPVQLGDESLVDAPYLPFDGMNEAGLAIGMMAVPHAEGGSDPQEVTLDSLGIIRLLLDYAGDVDEAIDLLQDYNVDFGGGPPVHYLIADPSGRAAVIEYIDDEVVVIENDQPWLVATNFVIAEAPDDPHICLRYQTASQTLEQAAGLITEAEAMALLSDVSSSSGSNPTMWSVVYNMTTGDFQVSVGRQYEKVYSFHLDMLPRR
jgi:hypothetical protein